ncbi:trypsin alpha-3-like [Uranotaenia lowii]|uniref:trypsin alpha-3-like n=1 Tax=Uranotaenia lowii TaxID=190385 RepID=UPI002478502F|nr:trypsin alpha-3-like [Uranotaenia lowii]
MFLIKGFCLGMVLLSFGAAAASLESTGGSIEPRIVGGFLADARDTRHQVSIRVRSIDENRFGSGHSCGGSLINNVTVLTAAHCLVDDNDRQLPARYFRVVGGDLNRLMLTAQTEIRNVARVVVHQRYNPKNFDNDVGILILSAPIVFPHPTLAPINLATVKPNPLVKCQTSGWGTMEYGVNAAPAQLRAVNLTLQPTEVCNNTRGNRGNLLPGMICAGELEGGRDACQGDSGGPLVCNGLLTGIVSHGYRCAEPDAPGVYMDVAYYREWIRANGASVVGSIFNLVALVVCLSIVAMH